MEGEHCLVVAVESVYLPRFVLDLCLGTEGGNFRWISKEIEPRLASALWSWVRNEMSTLTVSQEPLAYNK